MLQTHPSSHGHTSFAFASCSTAAGESLPEDSGSDSAKGACNCRVSSPSCSASAVFGSTVLVSSATELTLMIGALVPPDLLISMPSKVFAARDTLLSVSRWKKVGADGPGPTSCEDGPRLWIGTDTEALRCSWNTPVVSFLPRSLSKVCCCVKMHDLLAAVFTNVNSVASDDELHEESRLEEFFRDRGSGWDTHGQTCSETIMAGVAGTTVEVEATDAAEGAMVTLGIFTLHVDSSSVPVLSLPTSTLPQVRYELRGHWACPRLSAIKESARSLLGVSGRKEVGNWRTSRHSGRLRFVQRAPVTSRSVYTRSKLF